MTIVSGGVSLVGYPPMVPSRGSSDSPCGSGCRDVKVTVSSLKLLSPWMSLSSTSGSVV